MMFGREITWLPWQSPREPARSPNHAPTPLSPPAETSSVDVPLREALVVLRVVLASLLVSLLWKIKGFVAAYVIYCEIPLHSDFFPHWLQDSRVVATAYVVSVVACMLAAVTRDAKFLCGQMLIANAALAVLCLHQDSYNDVTFLTCWWTSLWCTWLVSRLPHDTSAQIINKGAFLARLILSVIFLGGAVGKFTGGYWSGQVLYEIYFAERQYWLFSLLRQNFDDETLRQLATGYSRLVILTEACCAFLWLLPSARACSIAVAVLLGIALLSNTLLFSVLSCLMGLALVGLHRSPAARLP